MISFSQFSDTHPISVKQFHFEHGYNTNKIRSNCNFSFFLPLFLSLCVSPLEYCLSRSIPSPRISVRLSLVSFFPSLSLSLSFCPSIKFSKRARTETKRSNCCFVARETQSVGWVLGFAFINSWSRSTHFRWVKTNERDRWRGGGGGRFQASGLALEYKFIFFWERNTQRRMLTRM